MIIVAKRCRKNRGLLAIENKNKIAMTEITKVLNVINLVNRYN